MTLKTQYVFLDTSVFVSNNYNGTKIKTISKFTLNESIQLLTNSIVIRETKSRIQKSVQESRKVLKNIRTAINKESPILRNIDDFTPLYKVVDLDPRKHTESLISDFVNDLGLLDTKDIGIENIDYSKIINNYFDENPPFKDGNKKNEFPDAFILSSLENWCQINSEISYLVTTDKDLLGYKSDKVIPINLDDFLHLLIGQKEYDDLSIADSVKSIIEHIQPDLEGEIINYFKYHFDFDESTMSLEDLSLDKITLIDFKVIDYVDNKAIIHASHSAQAKLVYETIFLNTQYNSLDKRSNLFEGEFQFDSNIEIVIRESEFNILSIDFSGLINEIMK
jgi:hypothetical protein